MYLQLESQREIKNLNKEVERLKRLTVTRVDKVSTQKSRELVDLGTKHEKLPEEIRENTRKVTDELKEKSRQFEETISQIRKEKEYLEQSLAKERQNTLELIEDNEKQSKDSLGEKLQ